MIAVDCCAKFANIASVKALKLLDSGQSGCGSYTKVCKRWWEQMTVLSFPKQKRRTEYLALVEMYMADSVLLLG